MPLKGLWMTFLFMGMAPSLSDRVPNFWVWAEGVYEAEGLEAYRKWGMTVLWVSLPLQWEGEAIRELIEEAKRQDLPFLLALDLRPPPTLRPRFRMAPHDAHYLNWLRQRLKALIPRFRDAPNLLGYALGRSPDEALRADDEGFLLFLQRRYGSLENLSKAWGVPLNSWQEITQDVATRLDDSLSPIRYGRPSLDAALYRWTTLRALLTLWAQEVRRLDPDPKKVLVAGPLTTYRSLAAVPPHLYQIVVPFLSPEEAEPDGWTHNVHAVSIARRGQQFRVVPLLTTRFSDGRLVDPKTLTRWMVAALAHGSSGFAFTDKTAFDDRPDLWTAVAAMVAHARKVFPRGLRPRPIVALLYTPFAEGPVTVHGIPLYGFAIPKGQSFSFPLRLGLNEPSPLFAALRFHAWGTFDTLIPDPLNPDALNREILLRYRVIFAPMPVFLPPPLQGAIAEYVARGGIFIADFGVGAMQTKEPFVSFPPTLQRLFGVSMLRRILMMEPLRVNMLVYEPHTLFPTLKRWTELGKPYGAFPYIVGLTHAFTAHPWAILTLARFGKRGRFPGRIEVAAAFINAYGMGYALFVPTLLWAEWTLQDPGFADFHGSLIARHAPWQLVGESPFNPSLWVSRLDGNFFVYNPTGRERVARLRLKAPQFWAYSDCSSFPVAPGVQALQVRLNPDQWLLLRPIAHLTPPSPVQVTVAEPDRLEMFLEGSAATPFVTVRIFGTIYKSSLPYHQILIRTPKGQEDRGFVRPDRWGVLTFQVPSRAAITVTPALTNPDPHGSETSGTGLPHFQTMAPRERKLRGRASQRGSP